MSGTPRPDVSDTYLLNDFFALGLGQLAAERLTEKNLAAFEQSLDFMRERHGDTTHLQMWKEITSRGPEAVAQAFTEPSERGQILRSVISFNAFVTPQERDMMFKHAEDIADRHRVDQMVATTINISTTRSTTAAMLARWIKDEIYTEPGAASALTSFFGDVPLDTQVAFLRYHKLDEEKAAAFAEYLGLSEHHAPFAERDHR